MRPRALPGLLILLAPLLLATAARGARAEDDGRAAVKALRKGLREDDPSLRIAALRDIERAARRLPDARRRSAAVAVKKALPDEPVASVRGAMIRALASVGGATGWVPVILASRDARDDAVRREARQAVLWGGGDYLDVVQRLLHEDEDPTFRARLLLMLGDRRKPDAVGILLDHLDGKTHPRVRSAAAEALEAITGGGLRLRRGRVEAVVGGEGQGRGDDGPRLGRRGDRQRHGRAPRGDSRTAGPREP